MVSMDYATILFVLGFLATMVGQRGIAYLIAKYRKRSLIVLSIAGVVGLATVLMGITGFLRVSEDLKTGQNLRFRSVC